MFELLMKVILYLIIYKVVLTQCNSQSKINCMYATKTRFNCPDTNAGSLGLQIEKVLSNHSHAKCRALHFNCVFRHGIRNPGKKDIARVNSFFSMIKEHLKEDGSKLQNLYNWSQSFTEASQKNLAMAGAIEVEKFGRVYGKYIKTENGINSKFIASETNRTIESCHSFAKGFHDKFNKDMKTKYVCSISNDTMRFFDECKHYLNKLETKQMLVEYKNFQTGKEMNEVLANIKRHIGQKADEFHEITHKHLKAAYVIAGVETAIYGSSPWAEIFSEEDLQVLEYTSDLKSYWKKSHGHKINYEQSCPLMRDIFQQLDKVVHNQVGQYRGIFRFGHAETVLPLLTLLGLYRDEVPLRADNYKEQRQRLFKTGILSPFAANLVFVLVKCDNDEGSSAETNFQGRNEEEYNELSYSLLLLHNEKPVQLPCCQELVCPYSTVRQYYKKWIDDCDFEHICSTKHDETDLKYVDEL